MHIKNTEILCLYKENFIILKNFFNFHKYNISFLFFISIFILYAFYAQILSLNISLEAKQMIVGLVNMASLNLAAIYTFPLIRKDKELLVRHFSKKRYLLLSYLRISFLLICITTTCFILPLFLLDLMSFAYFMAAYAITIFYSFLVIVSDNLIKATLEVKELHKSSIFNKKIIFISHEVSSIIFLISLYLFRKNKQQTLKALGFILFINLISYLYLVNTKDFNKMGLFLVPFLVTLQCALNQNSFELKATQNYISSNLKIIFIADFIFWLMFFLLQWGISFLIISLTGLNIVQPYILTLILFPLVLSYCMIIKAMYQSTLLISLILCLSLVMPLVIPIFIWFFLRNLKND